MIRKVIGSQMSVVTGATIVNGVLGFVFFWLLARIFTPSELGVFAIFVASLSLLTDIASIGTDTGVINFVGRYIKTDHKKALRFLKLAFETKFIIAVMVLVVGWISIPVIVENVFGKSELVYPLRLSLVGATSAMMFGFSASGLQALQKFRTWGLLNIGSNFTRLSSILLIFILGVASLDVAIYIYVGIPFIAFLIGLFYLPNFFKVKEGFKVAWEFFHYNKWVAIFTVVAAIASRLDIFMTTKFLSLADVGIYSVALTLTGVVPQLVGAVGTVIAPNLAGSSSRTDAYNYFWRMQRLMGGLVILILICGNLIGYIFITKFYDAAYWPSFGPFVVLLIAQCIFLFSVPIHMMVMYYYSYPKLFLYSSVVNLVIILGFGYVLISNFGFIGASLTILIGNISNFVIPAIWVYKKRQGETELVFK